MKTNHLDQLRSEKAEAARKRDQAQRQANNQIEYVQKRNRSERTHPEHEANRGARQSLRQRR